MEVDDDENPWVLADPVACDVMQRDARPATPEVLGTDDADTAVDVDDDENPWGRADPVAGDTVQRSAWSATPEAARTDVDGEVDVGVDRMKRIHGSTWSRRELPGDVTDERWGKRHMS